MTLLPPAGAVSSGSLTSLTLTAILRGDFNRDGNPDIFWQNENTGQNAIWYMNGTIMFLGALVILLPGILTHPTQASPYVIAYGGAAAFGGLVAGLILWATATAALKLYTHKQAAP